MRDNISRRRGYILTALGGVAVGGLFVAVATKALTRVMGKMREMMSE